MHVSHSYELSKFQQRAWTAHETSEYVPDQAPHTPPPLHVRLCVSLAHVAGALAVDA